MTNTTTGITRDEARRMVGPGWSGLIDEVYDVLPSDAIVMDCKEKFGGLRIYWYGGTDEQYDTVIAICRKSFAVCERCGRPGKPRDGGWILTLCDEHAEAREHARRGQGSDR